MDEALMLLPHPQVIHRQTISIRYKQIQLQILEVYTVQLTYIQFKIYNPESYHKKPENLNYVSVMVQTYLIESLIKTLTDLGRPPSTKSDVFFTHCENNP